MRQTTPPLAILGGRPAFEAPLHVGRPNIADPERFAARTKTILETRWLTNGGPMATAFERAVADYVGAKHCVLTANGTIAMQLLAACLDLKGEVIVPAFTFISTATAFTWQGLRPVFCDVLPDCHSLDPEAAEALITPETAAIVCVRLWGRATDTGRLEQLAARHGLPLIFDSAHAFAAACGGRMAGTTGRAEVFSFHATKIINTFEGGAVTTNDDALAERLSLARNFGFYGTDNVVALGINAKLNEVSAAMGLTMLEDIGQIIETNRANDAAYATALQDVPGVRLAARPSATEQPNFHYVVLEVDPEVAGISRDLMLRVLRAEGVLARRYFYPGCHRTAPYRDGRATRAPMPVTEILCERLLQLPTGTAIDETDIAAIGRILRTASAHAEEIRAVAADQRDAGDGLKT